MEEQNGTTKCMEDLHEKANQGIRDEFIRLSHKYGFNLTIPKMEYCTDNAAMIACAGYYQYKEYPGLADLTLNPDASLELEDKYPLKEE